MNDGMSIVCATAGGGALLGVIAGQTTQLLVPSVSAAGYGLIFGLWLPVGLGIYKVSEDLNRNSPILNIAMGIFGGYAASWAITNLMGFSVSMIGPFIGLAALGVVAATIATVVAPCVLCCGVALSAAN